MSRPPNVTRPSSCNKFLVACWRSWSKDANAVVCDWKAIKHVAHDSANRREKIVRLFVNIFVVCWLCCYLYVTASTRISIMMFYIHFFFALLNFRVFRVTSFYKYNCRVLYFILGNLESLRNVISAKASSYAAHTLGRITFLSTLNHSRELFLIFL